MTEVVSRFANSSERVALLGGLLDLRARLRSLGISHGNQWLNGSFVEDVESNEARPPNDIDIVTFAPRPVMDMQQWTQIIAANAEVFRPKLSQIHYRCDHYFVDTLKPAELIIADTTYWAGLFGHKRQNHLWKGMIAVPLNSDDAAAKQLLSGSP